MVQKIFKKDKVTINAVTENNPIIIDQAKKLVKFLSPRGPFNIQLFITPEKQPIIFEINPRFSTTLILSIEAGVNEVDLLINNYSDQTPKPKDAIEGIYLYRNWKNNFYKKSNFEYSNSRRDSFFGEIISRKIYHFKKKLT